MSLPRILIIDDLFGRTCTGPLNPQRADLCATLRLLDITSDHGPYTAPLTLSEPLAQVQFCRGQAPAQARVGATVVNDLAGTLEVVRHGWSGSGAGRCGPWALVLVDLCFTTGVVTAESTRLLEGMPEGQIADDDPAQYFGLGVVAALRREFPQLPVLILSSRPRREVSYQFAESGAVGFIDRNAPDAADRLREALWLHGLLQDHSGALVGRTINFLAALCRARRAALTRQHVQIVGERGTGKELLARYVHVVESAEDPRRRLPFIAVNSAVLSSSLFASELFGIKANTATGVDAREGLIASASTGNLFLDEIGDMPPEIQAALLRVLEDHQVVAVGARAPSAVDVRFLSATNVDLGSRTSPLRLDLLDRLRAGGLIALPPLRERRDDIPLLVASFLREAETLHAARARDVTPDALEMLVGHDWPGNVRALRSCVLEAVREYRDVEHLVPAHLFHRLAQHPSADAVESAPRSTHDPITGVDIDAYAAYVRSLDFTRASAAAWAGRLNDLERIQARGTAELLRAALEATRAITLDNPVGTVRIHPALRLATGNRALTAAAAADVIKRVLAPIADELTGVLKDAYETAVRLRGRPRQGPRR